jgi:hypothetical protein
MGSKLCPEYQLHFAATMGMSLSFLCGAGWYEFFWGDGDGERALFLSAAGLFAGPLAIGAGLSFRGDRRGRRWLRFGSFLFVFKPSWFIALWGLWDSPEFRQYLACIPPRKR